MNIFQSPWCSQLSNWEENILHDRYRTSELRNVLIQKLHVPTNSVNQLLDMKELRKYSLDLIRGIRESDCSSYSNYRLSTTSIVVSIVVLMVSYFLIANKRVQKWVSKQEYIPDQYRMKFIIMSRGLRRGRYFAAVLTGLSLMMDALIKYIQFSVIVSFFVSSSWPIHQYLFLGPSLPLTTSMLRRATGNSSDQSSYGINIGPMIAIFVLNRTISFLDDRVAHIMMT